ncbi:MAG TPA: hypothetical protein PLG41_15005 [Leptospiraceae bacterium]|nr:hypothetical protein [Leptospiraceae bacterium]
MQFKSFEENVEVNAQTVFAIVDGLRHFKSLSKKYLLSVSIGTEKNGEFQLEPNAWYSQDAWLSAFEKISNEIGDTTLYNIGLSIPKNAIFPPTVINIETAIQSIDIAYHLNHRKKGKILFDEKTGKMLEGIGHYGYYKLENQNMIISECNTPYPCAFDRGIISAMASRFKDHVNVVHDDTKPCRKKGAESCTYKISW